jgi:hypothetical protein
MNDPALSNAKIARSRLRAPNVGGQTVLKVLSTKNPA